MIRKKQCLKPIYVVRASKRFVIAALVGSLLSGLCGEAAQTGLHFSANPTSAEIFQARLFEEPLVPAGGEPTASENAALAAALVDYSQRSGPDDFSSLTGFLEQHPKSPWRMALLTDLGLEYYNTAHYSLALEAWSQAWSHAKDATDAKGKAIADRAVGELACMHARLGHVAELEVLLQSVEGRVFSGPATERISWARAGLADMRERPEVSFRCGPLALQRIKFSLDPKHAGEAMKIIHESASTPRGFSLTQVAELSQKVGLNLQMARRDPGAAFIVPSVVHWKVGHYAALVRQEGDRYLLQDPTFRNDVWASKAALEAETSGYFLVPAGKLAAGWHPLDAKTGDTVWGRGNVGGPDPGGGTPPPPPPPPCPGMAVARVDLLFVSLSLGDEPVGYSPPVGPAVRFPVRYNQRDPFQPAVFNYSNLGPKWTFDWLSYITDNPSNPLADVQYYRMGGFSRFFTGFNPATQTYAYQLYDQTKLVRTSASSYEMQSRDGSKLVFGQSDGSAGTSRKIFLTQIIDPAGNTAALAYDGNLRVVAITDAIGQVTTLTYGITNDIYKITKVTDPFGRFATFDYDATNRLSKITDVIGLTSQFTYDGGDFITSLITPYGTTAFTKAESGTTRSLETLYPDGSRQRVEFNQTIVTPPENNAPAGMNTFNNNLQYRNTYFWSRNACATGYGDYSKARIYHWLHTADLANAAGILESTKEPLEGRVWRDYDGQPAAYTVGTNSLPAHVGRVLDDGTTQLYTYAYDGFGHVTQTIDPVGRTMSYIYSTNGIDLLEVRQTRAGNNELLVRMTYNAQHLPLTRTDAAGQTTTKSYNARGQLIALSNAKGETTSYHYDANGYLLTVDGPLPGTNDSIAFAYDAFGRVHTRTDVSRDTVVFDYDDLDRLIKTTHPDGTFEQQTYIRLDPAILTDRAGRQTLLEHDSMQQLVKRTDPLNRVILFQWCSCGDIKSIIDPLGRMTIWNKDVQGRLVSKQFGDGSQSTYTYENAISRVRQAIDEKYQVIQYKYNRDNTLDSIRYENAAVATPGVNYSYDPDYPRRTSMSDGTGTTRYSYVPITATPALGASQLLSVDGPLPNDTIVFGFDELGRRVSRTINGIGTLITYDAAGRLVGESNALGVFSYAYDGSSSRLLTQSFPNTLTAERGYGDNLQDRSLQRITYKAGLTPLSEFVYGREIPARRITTWSQQAGVQSPSLYAFGYDDANELLSANVTNAGAQVNSFTYTYDPAGNRLSEQIRGANSMATYNALNQLSATTGAGSSRTNEWDAADRVAAVNDGARRTEFTYDGEGRLASLRLLTNGTQISLRRFVWSDNELCEERDATGAVTQRFFRQGAKLENGPSSGNYYYTRDHLGSIRELTDNGGNVRARYTYDPYGRRTKLSGDQEASFGFAGMFWSSEAALAITRFRAYDPELGRWLSRDPLRNAEVKEGPNLYRYVANNPISILDPLGLEKKCCEAEAAKAYNMDFGSGGDDCRTKFNGYIETCFPSPDSQISHGDTRALCYWLRIFAQDACDKWKKDDDDAFNAYEACLQLPCECGTKATTPLLTPNFPTFPPLPR